MPDTPDPAPIPAAIVAPPAAPDPIAPAVADPAPIALVALTVFQNPRVNGGEPIVTGDLFDAPDLDYARDAVRLRLADPATPEDAARLGGGTAAVRGPDGATVGIAQMARSVAPLPDSALPPEKRRPTGAGALREKAAGFQKAAGLLALLLALFLPFAPARAQNANPALFGDFSTALTTTPVKVLPAAPARGFLRLVHPGRPGDPTIWCSDTTNAPAPYTAGAIPLGPFGNSLGYDSVIRMGVPGYVSRKDWWCRTETGAGAITAEAH